MADMSGPMAEGDAAVHDNRSQLIHMANQIAQFFASYPEAEGVAAVAAHINQFWDPRMRRRFLAAVQDQHDKLHPLVAQALASVKG